jgi:2-amino-4-hydroxy-6-hydroxymethyldihydropteridine diphosphokinase
VELDPERRHPVFAQTLRDLLAQLDDTSVVRLLIPQPNSRYGSRPTCSAPSTAEPHS